MKKVQIGTVLYENDNTTKIYNKFSEYFKLDNEDDIFITYTICKEPSDELVKAIEDYYECVRLENLKYDEFVAKTADKVFAELSDEEKAYIFDHPDLRTHHFGLGLMIRNKYLYRNDCELPCNNVDSLSGTIVSKIASMLIENYDFDNLYYRFLYENAFFCHLRKLYYAFFGEYPDKILSEYEDLPDECDAAEKATEKVKSVILDEQRFKNSAELYGLSEKKFKEFKSYTDEYNKKHYGIIPYDIALLHCKSTDNKTRETLLNILKAILDETPNLASELPAFIFNQKDAVLLAVGAFGTSLKRFKKFDSDDDVIRTALKNNGEAIQYVKSEFRDNEEYVKSALSSEFGNALKMRCMIPYRDNKEFVKIALEANGCNIKWASERLRDDFDTAAFAVRHQKNRYPNSTIKNLSSRLRDSLEIALIDIKEGHACVEDYSYRLRNNDEVAKTLIATENKWKMYCMSERIRKKYDKSGSGDKCD